MRKHRLLLAALIALGVTAASAAAVITYRGKLVEVANVRIIYLADKVAWNRLESAEWK